jgi:hypothetical protein
MKGIKVEVRNQYIIYGRGELGGRSKNEEITEPFSRKRQRP